jgi:hypothetical protein
MNFGAIQQSVDLTRLATITAQQSMVAENPQVAGLVVALSGGAGTSSGSHSSFSGSRSIGTTSTCRLEAQLSGTTKVVFDTLFCLNDDVLVDADGTSPALSQADS